MKPPGRDPGRYSTSDISAETPPQNAGGGRGRPTAYSPCWAASAFVGRGEKGALQSKNRRATEPPGTVGGKTRRRWSPAPWDSLPLDSLPGGPPRNPAKCRVLGAGPGAVRSVCRRPPANPPRWMGPLPATPRGTPLSSRPDRGTSGHAWALIRRGILGRWDRDELLLLLGLCRLLEPAVGRRTGRPGVGTGRLRNSGLADQLFCP